MKRVFALLLICLLVLGGCGNKNTTGELAAGAPVSPMNKPEPGTESWRFTGSLPYQEMWQSEKESINYAATRNTVN